MAVGEDVNEGAGGPIFLETTAYFDLALGESRVRKVIEDLVRNQPLHVSTYVEMEFHRTALQAIRVVLECMRRKPPDDSSQTLAYLLRSVNKSWDSAGRPISERGRKRATGIIAALIDHFRGIAVANSVVQQTLEDWLMLFNDVSWLGISVIHNRTDCDLVRRDRQQGQRWPLHCNANHAQCQQTVWLRTRRSDLVSVLGALRQLTPPPDVKLLAALERIMDGELVALGERRCWPIGDLILALEATESGSMITKNRRHLEPIAIVLGLKLITYSG